MTTTKKITGAMLAVLALATLLPSSHGRAQGPARSAAHVASEVQTFYDQTRTVETAFTQAYYDRVYQRTTRSRGVLTIARPGKLRFDYLGGDGKVVVSDGRTLTVYEPGDGAGQYAQSAVSDESIPSSLGFLTGQARLDRDFTFRLVDPARFGWDGYVLELRPRRAEPAYRRMFMFVGDDARVAGVVQRVLVQDHDGNLNRFDFRRMRFNQSVSAGRFAFTPPAGARRI